MGSEISVTRCGGQYVSTNKSSRAECKAGGVRKREEYEEEGRLVDGEGKTRARERVRSSRVGREGCSGNRRLGAVLLASVDKSRAGIRSFNVGKAAALGNTFQRHSRPEENRRFQDLWILYRNRRQDVIKFHRIGARSWRSRRYFYNNAQGLGA